ncbi:MAG TPA: YfiR family protein [Lacunisphaera sp.]|nr:YfiR family protein [Lacunisphaera sp.]
MEVLGPFHFLPIILQRTGWPGRGLALFFLLLAGANAAATPVGAPAEYQLKAVFLFNFAQFVEWPPAAFEAADSPLVIGILGDDPFGPVLDETVRGEKIGPRPLAVRRYKRAGDIDACHILFISRSEEVHIVQVATELRDRPILTVSDIEGAARRGVMIRFITENRRIRLRINLESARAAGLTISSKLLRPAEIVNDETP